MAAIKSSELYFKVIIVFSVITIVSVLSLTNILSSVRQSDRVEFNDMQRKGLQTFGEKNLLENNRNKPWVEIAETKIDSSKEIKPDESRKKGIYVFNISDWDSWTCKNCVSTKFQFLINNPNLCSTIGTQKTVELLIIIITKFENMEYRQTLRKSWLSVAKRNKGTVRYMFLFGVRKNKKIPESLRQESDEFQDIVLGEFYDNYLNLTTKTICGLRWADTYCANAKYVMKTDDDMWIHTTMILKLLKGNENTKMVAGACAQYSKPIRSKEGEFGKFYVTLKEYPLQHYPPYVQGLGYILSMNVVQLMLEMIANTPFYRFEDVYMGHCYAKLRLNLTCLPGFKDNVYSYYTEYMNMTICSLKSEEYMTVHKVPLKIIRKVWNLEC